MTRPSRVALVMETSLVPPVVCEYIEQLETRIAQYEAAQSASSGGRDTDRMRAAVPEQDVRGRAHSEGPDTAKAAAAANAGRSGSQKHRVFLAIGAAGYEGRTFDELRRELDMYSAQKRLHDLKLGEWVAPRDDGAKRPTETGALAEVYVLSNKGREHYERERAGRVVL